MDPFPLVAFSLKLPSRMGDSLRARFDSTSSSSSNASSTNSNSDSSSNSQNHPYFVINILSASQARIAVLFSRPDLYPSPFGHPHAIDEPSHHHFRARAKSKETATETGFRLRYHRNEEGIPVIDRSLGALACTLVKKPIALGGLDLDLPDPATSGAVHFYPTNTATSELYIARVTRVEDMPSNKEDEEQRARLPLVYHRGDYSTLTSLTRRLEMEKKMKKSGLEDSDLILGKPKTRVRKQSEPEN